MKGFMNTLFLSSSWKVVVQDLLLSLLSFRGPHTSGNPESRNKTRSFSNKQTGSQVHAWDDNYNNGSRIKTLRDDGQRCIISCCRFVGLRHYKNSMASLIKRVRPICRLQGSGFTLIELLVVVLIIGILAAAALPSYRVAVGTSRAATMYAFMRAVDQAQQHFYMQTNRYATNFDSLVIALPAGFKRVSPSRISNNDIFCYIMTPREPASSSVSSSIKCEERKNAVTIEKYHTHSFYMCWASKDNSLATRICQNLSGRDTHDGTGTDGDSIYFLVYE